MAAPFFVPTGLWLSGLACERDAPAFLQVQFPAIFRRAVCLQPFSSVIRE
jgi:hypothetical protein